MTAPEIAIPDLDGKTAKMYRYVRVCARVHSSNVVTNDARRYFSYRGGKICMTDHFQPLWARNVPRFGIAHALALGVSTDARDSLR